MRGNKRMAAALLILVLATVGVLLFGYRAMRQRAPASSKGSIEIGSDLPTSGADHATGLPVQYGAAFAVAQAGTVRGFTLKFAGCLALLSPVIAHNLGSLPSIYWHNVVLNVAAIVVSVVSCVLLGTFTSTATRSMSAGLTAAMVWLPAENILVGIMAFAVATTHSDLVIRASGWLQT